MQHPDDERDPLEVIADEFIAAHRRGESPRINEWAARHADQGEDVRRLLETVLAMEQVRPDSGLTSARSGAKVHMMPTPTKIGDYRILREIGRGGMGIVYKAEQQSLERLVALKVLPKSSLLDEHQLQRFHREAQTAARLHHTNIVPVFGVGEFEGLHYFVMQLIEGVGLDKVIRELRRFRDDGAESTPTGAATTAASAFCRGGLNRKEAESSTGADVHIEFDAEPMTGAADAGPVGERPPTPAGAGRSDVFTRTYWQAVARLGIQVASALHYAHGRGILHRDIKPSNLLLDSRGIVWVTDFGIAKALEKEGLTEAGDFVGTLQYMAPEQAQGQQDRRGDVYSLGLTLYELATLRRGFEGRTPKELLRLITETEPARPRKIVPSMPLDLETIIQKAIARDIDRRYGGAGELADDLRRFVEDRPIMARRTGAIGQVWRWCRRNRTVATLTAATVIAVIGAGIVGWTGWVSTQGALGRESQRRTEADNATMRAERNLELALAAFGDVFDAVAGPDTFDLEGGDVDEDSETITTEVRLSEHDAALLERILAFYDVFAVENAGNARLADEKAKAHRRVGLILRKLGRIDHAASAFGKSLETYDAIQRRAPSDETLIEIAGVHQELGILHLMSRRMGDGMAEFNRAIEILKSKVSDPQAPRVRYEGVKAQIAIAKNFMPRGEDWQRRRGSDRPSAPGERAPAGGSPPGPGSRPRSSTGSSDYFRDLETRAAANLAAATDLLHLEPKNPGYRFVTAQCLELVARAKQRASPDEAQTRADEAILMLEALVAELPHEPDYRVELAETLFARARAAPQGKAPTPGLLRAHELTRELTRLHEEIPAYANIMARIALHIGRIYLAIDRPADAEVPLRRAIDAYTLLNTRLRTNLTYGFVLSDAERALAEALEKLGRLDEARAVVLATIARIKSLAADPRRGRMTTVILSTGFEAVARLSDALDDTETASRARQDLQSLREESESRGRR